MANIIGGSRYSPSNCVLPNEKPTSIYYVASFNNEKSGRIELIDQFRNESVSSIQTMYFYNRNDFGVLLTISDTRQQLYISPNTQGYIPIMIDDSGFIDITSNINISGTIDFHFINVPIYPIVLPTVSTIL